MPSLGTSASALLEFGLAKRSTVCIRFSLESTPLSHDSGCLLFLSRDTAGVNILFLVTPPFAVKDEHEGV